MYLRTIFVIMWCFTYSDETEALSEAQFKAAARLVRNVCQPKFKATDADIEAMHNGNWNIDRTAMCYLWCGVSMNKLLFKNNTIDYETGLKLLHKNVPLERKAAALDSFEKCKDSIKTLNDKCVAAYEFAKCFYDTHPENYLLP